MVNLLIFPRYTSVQASTRVRFLQFMPYLNKQGIAVEHFSLLSNNSINTKHHFFKLLFFRFTDIVGTIIKISTLKNNTVIHIHIELFPWLPFWLENSIMNIFGINNYSIEYDDAWFHRYDKHPNLFIRYIYKNKISKLMKHAQLVIAGNDYISAYAKLAGAKNVEIIPTVVDFKKYNIYEKKSKLKPIPVIGWIGTPATTKFLVEIKSVISFLHEEKIAVFHAFGADQAQLQGLPIEVIPWDAGSEISTLYGFDIGIMPLHDSWFERGKCGYKLIQYMACGIPVVASPVGVNNDIVINGVNGFLAKTEREWIDLLTKLCLDSSLRNNMGSEGKMLVSKNYSVEAVQEKLANLFNKLTPYNSNEKFR